MNASSLGVCADDLRLEVKDALQCARTMGFGQVDLGATRGPISPAELSKSGQRHLIKHLSDLGLGLASLRGPADARSYTEGSQGERRLETMRGVIRLAADLHVPVVSTTLLADAKKQAGGEEAHLREVLSLLADDADRLGVKVAIEPAGFGAADLRKWLAEINCPALSACCDTGSMLMQGDNPHDLVATLGAKVDLVIARDALAGTAQLAGREVAPGEGQLDVGRFLGGLAAVGYDGPLMLSRREGQRPMDDLVRAKREFEKYLL
jgi:sugar phosphate isomerase/epimerase